MGCGHSKSSDEVEKDAAAAELQQAASATFYKYKKQKEEKDNAAAELQHAAAAAYKRHREKDAAAAEIQHAAEATFVRTRKKREEERRASASESSGSPTALATQDLRPASEGIADFVANLFTRRTDESTPLSTPPHAHASEAGGRNWFQHGASSA